MRQTTSKTTSALDELGSRAADAAMRGAINALVPAGTRPGWTDAQVEELLAAVRAETKAALPEALRDAEDAFKAGMGGFAGPTFIASMTLAGARAGRAWAARKEAARG